jgi:heparosan-N-sulfate-glucuronate 5-epimerase
LQGIELSYLWGRVYHLAQFLIGNLVSYDRECHHIAVDVQGQKLSSYYIAVGHKEHEVVKYGRYYHYDEEGIPQITVAGRYVYNPVATAKVALGHFELYLQGASKEAHYTSFIKLADWLLKTQVVESQGIGLWYYDFDIPDRCRAPWGSAMAQGLSISVLLRAFQETNEQRYLDGARLALNAFKYTVEEGGVTSVEEDGSVFYEEVAQRPLTHTLNGFIYSLWGIYDFYRVTRDSAALKLFQQGVIALKQRIGDYDSGKWSYYNLSSPPRLASLGYHKVHTSQLYVMHRITGIDNFYTTAVRWHDYQRPVLVRLRVFSQKLRSRQGKRKLWL